MHRDGDRFVRTAPQLLGAENLLKSALSNTSHDLQFCDFNIWPQMSKGFFSQPSKFSSSVQIPELMYIQQTVELQ